LLDRCLYHLSHSTSHFLKYSLLNYLSEADLNCRPPDLCFLSR
jgi:hypothetical protein